MIHSFTKRRVFSALVLAAGLIAGALPARAADPLYSLSPLGSGPLVIPGNATVGGFTVGGLSGITYAGGNTYYSILDNQGGTLSRFYTLQFLVTDGGVAPLPGQTASQVPTAVTTLSAPTGTLDGNNFDSEGIALTPAGTLLIASEREPTATPTDSAPSIREFSLAGAQIGAPLSVPALFTRDAGATTGMRSNLGFESLTLSADGNTLWTASEEALIQDGPTITVANGSLSRLLRYNRSGGAYVPGAQFVYPVSPLPPAGLIGDGGLVDLIALPGGDLLALERDASLGLGSTIRIFQVSLAGATDVSGFSTLAGQTYTPAVKTLLFDFAASGFAPDNIEGMGFGPLLPNGDRTIVVVSDNNFNTGLQTTQIAALRLVAPAADVPEPGALVLLVAALPLLAGVVTRRARRRCPLRATPRPG